MEEPKISLVINWLGWLSIIPGALLLAFGMADQTGSTPSLLAPAVVMLISGVCFLALAAIISKLYQIEYHLSRAPRAS